ncbi:relaxase/mobilization nuclease domain-containing protein [Sphingobacterium hotanense]|uniref:relaxase/mobilization nuclease domain-containing protein n=1 Tax=Sphingobacterium hotanense TaxID=649196 RepID=UPI0021A3A362|nr:relaxase/mobilization nuclease domain-containing protein [Sphingobacterium hotanense]MCT1526116.1 relaxase/mobilization nuclease domain-containing protein [Sphingobacterium hotanense]
MIAKVITGKSFGGCVRYLLEKEKAKVIDGVGVRDYDVKSIIADLNAQRKLRPTLGNAVGHTVLSWSKEDSSKLTEEKMAAHAREYMERMGIRDTQYLTVLHMDRQHPHVHIVYNRVDNSGKTIDNYNHWKKSYKVCREMTERHGYHIAKGKDRVNRQSLRGNDKLRYEIYDNLKAALQKAASWKQLEDHLSAKGIAIHYKYRSGTNEVQGILFEKDSVKFKGSEIDRSFSYGNINSRLNENLQTIENTPTLAGQIREILSWGQQEEHQPTRSTTEHHGQGLFDILLDGVQIYNDPNPVGDAEKRRRKRKKQEVEQSRGIGR